MRKSRLSFPALIAVVLALAPQFAKAGPCTGGIAELETAVQLFGGNQLGWLERKPVSAQPQFSATMERAKRLDVQGERVGCQGALNAARRMYVLVTKQ